MYSEKDRMKEWPWPHTVQKLQMKIGYLQDNNDIVAAIIYQDKTQYESSTTIEGFATQLLLC
jgi:hypothetical protein